MLSALAVAASAACGGKAATHACAVSGASCAASGCCADPSEICLPPVNGDRICAFSEPPPSSGPACNGIASSTLDGVSLVFPDDRCSYSAAELAAGVDIKYTLVVAHDLAQILPVAGNDGPCSQPGADSGLIVTFSLGGQGQRYCLCDMGRCAPSTAVTGPRAGRYDAAAQWTGHNWSGPSDTNAPLGDVFPAGTYDFTVTAAGKQMVSADGGGGTDFLVTATRFITVEP